ncbi:exodeoxyribonuclease VII large subunit [Evansella sp. AB-rgal1]|uniref:exodeoxyribonuclease VII large subunit n=1 Tax=Evansella sp. AB-rgal1 TaxID=3242696 RepID=UPI00359ED361
MSRDYMSVSDLTKRIKSLIDRDTLLQNVWIRAEISNFKWHSRGHMYYTLKDDKSRVNAVMFAGNNQFLKFTPENGMNVLVRGDISVYEPHGLYQLYVKEMQPDGIGSLYLAFEELKKKLEMAGYFSKDIKKQIPSIPQSIAVITSPTGAAVRDIITTLERRFPLTKVTLLPALVQGPNAAPSIARAINQANVASTFDVIIVGRGGGSLEELWAFNEQIVAEAIYNSHIPVISAVGHETDITISDFVADLRAATPTAAAELAVPDIGELMVRIQDRKDRVIRAMDRKIENLKERLNYMSKSYAFRYPQQLLEQKEQDLDRLVESMQKIVNQKIDKQTTSLGNLNSRIVRLHPEHRIMGEKKKLKTNSELLMKSFNALVSHKKNNYGLLISKLNVLNPLNVMERGYSLVYNEEDKLIKSVHDTETNSNITIQLRDGKLHCQIHSSKEEELPQAKWSVKYER